MSMAARFDDLVAGRAWAFPPPYRVLTTSRADRVADVLAEVEASGGWAYGYVAYEAATGLDPALTVSPTAAGDPPLVWFGLCGGPVEVPVVRGSAAAPARWTPDWTEQEHAAAVRAVREQIAAGETYQCNLTSRLRAGFEQNPFDLYAALATAQRGAHHAYVDMGRFVVASASPELFFEWAGDRIRTRPMKGTAARHTDPVVDAHRARGLRASAKVRAENGMIVDLLRNDLARIAAVGSVAVPELLTVERYPTVWQLTSEVTARVRPGIGLVDVFRALFPCGSVTGAPKAASMRVIRDLEAGPRGVYCGAIGLVAPRDAPVRARFSVAIRTAVVDRTAGTAVYGAGGGITWDSDPAAEWAELLAKAAVLGRRPVQSGRWNTRKSHGVARRGSRAG
jgi:para-aminobenzoate synthetase/4-amino-4-deoxychorismate lyase